MKKAPFSGAFFAFAMVPFMAHPADPPRRDGRRPTPPARPQARQSQDPKWGSVARRGARSIGLPVKRAVPGEDGHPRGPAPEWEPEQWQRDDKPDKRRSRQPIRGPRPTAGSARAGAGRDPAPNRSKRSRSGGSGLAPEVSEVIARNVKGRGAAGVERRMAQGAEAFEHDRIADAVRILRPLASDHPDLAPVRELTGLALYRSGKWAEAARHLEAARTITGTVDHHPVLADCYRALRRYPLADTLWKELCEASPEPAILTEGRIVAAGVRADRGDLAGAIALLEAAAGSKGGRKGGVVPIWTVRLWYALADLHERSGNQPRAREMFTRVVVAEPDMADAAERLSTLT